ncbi:hypothetical protein TrLO_g10000 [Triparma laevis f. longispina]|uniref:Protein kinase domain-containing protein n=1 Tax=Triparma laevis f. longispina TaxID=1714387 RepID=A0A9W7DUP9_9STRA|nr:hypothetical protein TrLO_g10000 [Triparma laevis f. longispina]
MSRSLGLHVILHLLAHVFSGITPIIILLLALTLGETTPAVVKVGVLKNDGFEACCPDIGLIWDDAVDAALEHVKAVGFEGTMEMILEEHVAVIFGAVNEYGKVILALLNEMNWKEVSYINDLEENGAGFADSSISDLQSFLEPRGIATLTRAKFPYFEGLDPLQTNFDSVLDTLRGSPSRTHIVSSQNALFTAFLFAMRDDGEFNMDDHYFIFINDFKNLNPANYDADSSLPYYYADPPHQDYLALSKNVFLLGFSSFNPSSASRYKEFTEALFLKPYQNQRCDPYKVLGNEIPLWDAFDTILQAIDRLHRDDELLISVSSDDLTFMTLYKQRNAKLHQAMLAGNFSSVTGQTTDFYDTGDKKSPVKIYMIEAGNALPENSLEWTPCESRSPYRGLNIVELTSSCVGEIDFEGCATWTTPATSISWKNGEANIPPATIERSLSSSKMAPELLKEYNANEKKLIEAQIVEFKQEFAEGKQQQGSTNSDLNKVLISASKLESEEVIGKGAFGEVFRGKYHGQEVAVKTLISVDHESLTHFREEILLMADLHHANIVVIVGNVVVGLEAGGIKLFVGGSSVEVVARRYEGDVVPSLGGVLQRQV